MQKEGNYLDNWYKKEDYWAIIIAMGIILVATVGFFAGYHKLLNILTVNIPTWSTSFEKLSFYFAEHNLLSMEQPNIHLLTILVYLLLGRKPRNRFLSIPIPI